MRFLVDIGNTRLKMAVLETDGDLSSHQSSPVDCPDSWANMMEWSGGLTSAAEWGIVSVRPQAAGMVSELLQRSGVTRVQWFCSASDTPVRHQLENPEKAGADRAMAVLGFNAKFPGRSGVVMMCGTAITAELVAKDGCWLGGAIAPGWRAMTGALRDLTAQLPASGRLEGAPRIGVGVNTLTALQAGLYGMLIGGCRELILGLKRQASASEECLTVWTGGDAHWLAREVEGQGALVESDLVLRGLAVAMAGR